MSRLSAALLLSALPSLSGAEPLVDLALLFDQHANRVVVTTNGGLTYRNLDLGDGVHTRCKGETGHDACVSIDINGRGETTDCILSSVAYTLLLARKCEVGGAARRFVVESVFDDVGEHVARNAVPPRDWADLRPRVLERVAASLPADCSQMDDSSRDFLEYRMRLDRLKTALLAVEKPRLPVGQCLD
ncbi:hypothetical protein LHP98_13625 [Rhodobacter sp. Har01]|uniref:hypothetical protein n=1 Tax=Rhodobacter sp. Har01 TaxID=2883999 RepID=UPI001D06A7C4|nr:hypothetical protein [Rhodobacter sp. Har01]MCB6179160.1 hypothetical protein [Rhodobacter sp. Har01]